MQTEIKLGTNIFNVTPLPALKSFVLQPRLAPAVVEVFGALGMAASAGDIGGVDISVLAPMVGSFFSKLPAAELELVLRELLGTATMDGTPLFTANGNPFDVLMRGRMLDVWKLLWHAVRVNYPDFLGLLGASGEAKGPMVSPSGGSTT